MPKLMKLPYQLKAVRKIEHFKGRALLADEMGLGKTVEALLWIKNHPKRKPVIIVCPASLKWVWESFVHQILKIRCNVLSGTTPPKKGLIGKHPFLIINYEILQYWLPYLKGLQPKILIVDECHYQKSRTAKRTKAVWNLSKGIPHVLALSGTPLTNRPAELWTTLRLIRPNEFKAFLPFGERYCKPVTYPWGRVYKGADNLKELHRKLSSMMMIRRLKKDVLKELPDKTRHVIPLEIERKEYNEAVKSFIKWLTKKSISKAKRAAKAEKLVKMGYLKRLAAELKMGPVLNWIDNFLENSDGKIVLFCVHKKIIKMLHDKYKNKCVMVDGSVKGPKRKIAVRSFQNNKKKRLFIGNIKAAGVGITLTAASSLAFVEIDWVPANMWQAEDRIHRIGQKNAANIYYLIAKYTIEEDIMKILDGKANTVIATLDGKEPTKDSLFNTILKKYQKKT